MTVRCASFAIHTLLRSYDITTAVAEGTNAVLDVLISFSMRKTAVNPFHMEELVACVRGEVYCRSTVALYATVKSQAECEDYVTLECEGGSLQYPKRMLCSRFHFFTDFFDSFGSSGLPSVKLEWSVEEVEGAVLMKGLASCDRVVDFFMPRSGFYPLFFDLTDVPREQVLRYIRGFSSDEEALIKKYTEGRSRNKTLSAFPSLRGKGMLFAE